MYKLTLGSINELKYSNTDAHGLFSGTIETDRVVLVDGDGKYLQTDGNFGTDLKNGLVRTWSATRDSAETTYLIATTDATSTAAVYVYDGIMKLQSDYSSVDGFIEELADTGVITIQGYESPKYELNAASVKTAGSGYTDASIDVTVPGQSGDTAGVVTVTITEGACSGAEIKTAGSYETLVATQDLTVGTGNGKITVTMAAITDASDAKGTTRSMPEEKSEIEEPIVETKGEETKRSVVIEEPEPEPEPEAEESSEPEQEEESKTEPELEVEPEVAPESEEEYEEESEDEEKEDPEEK